MHAWIHGCLDGQLPVYKMGVHSPAGKSNRLKPEEVLEDFVCIIDSTDKVGIKEV